MSQFVYLNHMTWMWAARDIHNGWHVNLQSPRLGCQNTLLLFYIFKSSPTACQNWQHMLYPCWFTNRSTFNVRECCKHYEVCRLQIHCTRFGRLSHYSCAWPKSFSILRLKTKNKLKKGRCLTLIIHVGQFHEPRIHILFWYAWVHSQLGYHFWDKGIKDFVTLDINV